jgi:hypothetical protein
MAIRKRKTRTSSGARKTQALKGYGKRGHAKSRRYGERVIKDNYRPAFTTLFTFEDEYKTFRRTRGRVGLNYNPLKRPDENPMVGQAHMFGRRNCIIRGSGKFPIGQLMEHPITAGKLHHHVRG